MTINKYSNFKPSISEWEIHNELLKQFVVVVGKINQLDYNKDLKCDRDPLFRIMTAEDVDGYYIVCKNQLDADFIRIKYPEWFV